MRPPIIFIGMHRSGTSMLGQMLEEMGLFVGVQKDENNEALFFQEINTWLLAQCGGRWDVPAAMEYLWAVDAAVAADIGYIEDLMNSLRFAKFCGWGAYLRGGSQKFRLSPWGWKDPRNTFTLPIWLRIFPDAKVICIERHGVDVAESLRVRNQQVFEQAIQNYPRIKAMTPFRPKRSGFLDSPRCASFNGALSLWYEYVVHSDKVLGLVDESRRLKVSYENFLEDPVSQLQRCTEFCGLAFDPVVARRVTARINVDRAYPYRKSTELKALADDYAALLAERGYSP